MTKLIKTQTPVKEILKTQSSNLKAKYSILMFADLNYDEYIKDELFIANLAQNNRKCAY